MRYLPVPQDVLQNHYDLIRFRGMQLIDSYYNIVASILTQIVTLTKKRQPKFNMNI